MMLPVSPSQMAEGKLCGKLIAMSDVLVATPGPAPAAVLAMAWVQAGMQPVACVWKGMVLMAEGVEELQPPFSSFVSSFSSPPSC